MPSIPFRRIDQWEAEKPRKQTIAILHPPVTCGAKSRLKLRRPFLATPICGAKT
jgi:cell wall assembly regulator SMI1